MIKKNSSTHQAQISVIVWMNIPTVMDYWVYYVHVDLTPLVLDNVADRFVHAFF